MGFAEQRPSPEEVADLFLTPRPRLRAWPPDFLGDRRSWISSPGGRLATAVVGDGPCILLVHGWEGQGSDLAGFVPPLLEAGCRVAVMDLPAHGESEGVTTSLPACAQAVLAVADVFGPLRGVIAHSVGCSVVVEALARGLAADCVVLIAAPAHHIRYARHFAHWKGLNAAESEHMIRELQSRGVDVAAYSIPHSAKRLNQAALFIHSSGDKVITSENSIECAAAWRGAQLLRVENWGHLRMLQAPEVIGPACEFVARNLWGAVS